MAEITPGSEEAQNIARQQENVAQIKGLLVDVVKDASRLVVIQEDGGRERQTRDAKEWMYEVQGLLAGLRAAHIRATNALIDGFDNGGVIVVQGGGR